MKKAKNSSTKISVIIPIYNAEKYLSECLDSVINQSMNELEIICINDGSTDNSLNILREYAKKDDRIIILEQENKGVSEARNLGLLSASGEYVHFVDADDFLNPNLYTDILNVMKFKNLDICMFGHVEYMDGKEKDSFTKYIFEKFKKKALSDYNLILYFFGGVWNRIFKLAFLKKHQIYFPSGIKIAEDSIFGTLCVLSKPKFEFIDKSYYYYRINNLASASYKFDILIDEELKAAEYIQNKRQYKIAPKKIQEAIDLRTLSGLEYQYFRIPNKDAESTKVLKFLRFLKNKYGYKIFKNNSYVNLLKNVEGVIPVAISVNDNFALASVVCMYSILSNTKSYIDFYLLADQISDKNKKLIVKSLKSFKNFSLNFIDMKKYNLNALPIVDRFFAPVYSRFFIPEICSKYQKVVYTDADVIFCGDIKEYYNISLDGYGIAATPEEIGAPHLGLYNHIDRKNAYNITNTHTYFANGNLIIDCNYWRQNKITEKLLVLLQKYSEKLVCPDLDVMNVLFANNYKMLDYKYCCCVHRLDCCDGNKEMIDGFRNPFIIHFSGELKPWVTDKIAFSKVFLKYLKKTKYKKEYYNLILFKKLQKIFSIKNEGNHKVFRILGVKYKFKSKKLKERNRLQFLEWQINEQKKNFQKEINNLKFQNEELQKNIDFVLNNSLKFSDISNIIELSVLKAKYSRNFLEIPKMKNTVETVDELINTNKSIIRFGDGEYKILDGGDIVFQEQNQLLSDKLKEILITENDDLMIGIPQIYYEFPRNLRIETQKFIINWLPEWHNKVMQYIDINKTYYSQHFPICFPEFKKYDFNSHYTKLKQIWDKKNITIITGDRVFNKVEYNIFDNAKAVDYIYGPTTNAFEQYEQLKEKIKLVSKDKILIFALGPCGKVLAYDMYKLGYRVLDLGHLIKDYDFYNKAKVMTEEEFLEARKSFYAAD